MPNTIFRLMDFSLDYLFNCEFSWDAFISPTKQACVHPELPGQPVDCFRFVKV